MSVAGAGKVLGLRHHQNVSGSIYESQIEHQAPWKSSLALGIHLARCWLFHVKTYLFIALAPVAPQSIHNCWVIDFVVSLFKQSSAMV